MRWCLGLAIALALLLAACEWGLTLVGHSERSSISPQGGWMETSTRSANGSAVRDLELELSNVRLDTTVVLEVGEGAFHIELLDGKDNVTLSLKATPGQPAEGSGYMETDTFGDAEYRVTAEDAKQVHYRFEFGISR